MGDDLVVGKIEFAQRSCGATSPKLNDGLSALVAEWTEEANRLVMVKFEKEAYLSDKERDVLEGHIQTYRRCAIKLDDLISR